MTFYLKYRSKTIDELDITEVRESLSKIVKSGNIPHAFLFSGPKGTGKTSAARIIAKIANCLKPTKEGEPCNECEECISIAKGNNLDVIELDAASNRGIDDIRALREAVKLSPAHARKKVYIIDEAHMLTVEASNALLKTLEEPPEHVIFILATTNPEKLIDTVRSRAVNIGFRKGKVEEIERSLQRIVEGEKIKIGKEALNFIAKASSGSFRDAAKILEQLVSEGGSLEASEVENFLFKKKGFNENEFLDLLAKREVKKALEEIERMIETGVSTEILLESILGKLRKELLAKVGVGEDDLPNFSRNDLIILIELFTKAGFELKGTLIEQLPLEVAVVRWCVSGKEDNEKAKIPLKEEEKKEVLEKAEIKVSENRESFPARVIAEVSDEVWKAILAAVKPINTSIEALLKAAKPIGFDGKVLTLGVFYRFHKERLEDGRIRKILEGVAEKVLGTKAKVVCELTEPPPKKEVEEVVEVKTVLTEGGDKDIIKVAEEIFGS